MPVIKVESRDKLPAMPTAKLFYIEDEQILVRQWSVREEVTKADVAEAKAVAAAQIAATVAKKNAEIAKQQKTIDAMTEALTALDEATAK